MNLSAEYAADKHCAECGATPTREVTFQQRDNVSLRVTELLCSSAACLAGAQHARVATHQLIDDGMNPQ